VEFRPVTIEVVFLSESASYDDEVSESASYDDEVSESASYDDEVSESDDEVEFLQMIE
jgi:hypothetical protein